MLQMLDEKAQEPLVGEWIGKDQTLEEIQECHLVSGDFDYLLKTRVSDMSAYRRLLGETLLRLPGVNDTRTYVVMEEVKQTNRLVIKTR